MEELTLCSVCLEQYDNKDRAPLMLLCGHTYCRFCLNLIYARESGIVCPVDRQRDTRQLDKIPKNIAFMQLVEEISSHKRRKITYILSKTDKDRKQAVSVLDELQALSIELDAQEDKSLKLLQSGFQKVRQLVDKKENELKKNIIETHNALGKSITDFRNILNSFVKECESKIAYFSKVRDIKGDDAQVTTTEVLPNPPNYDTLSHLKLKASKLPVKVMLSPTEIENSLNKSARILDETQARGSEFSAEFVRDIRARPGEKFLPGSSFVKTWRVRNSGSKAWADGCWCVFSHGDFSGEGVIIDSAGVNEEIDISVICVAPEKLGCYKSYWRLVDPQGLPFGPFMLADISVVQIGL